MGDWIYVLTQRGRQECEGVTARVPPALRQILKLVDGQRTRDEVLAACGKSAVSAGGLIWLASGGYIQRVLSAWPAVRPQAFDMHPNPSLAPEAPARVAVSAVTPPARTPRIPDAAAAGKAAPTAFAAPQRTAKPGMAARTAVSADDMPVKRADHQPSHAQPDMQAALTAFIADTVRLHMSDDEDGYLYQVQRAASVGELIPLLHPLIDAVLEAAGPGAAAEFADGAAGILQP